MVVIMIMCDNHSPVPTVTSVSDGHGLTWNSRFTFQAVGSSFIRYVGEWWAVSASTLSSDTVTIAGTNFTHCTVYSIATNGANTGSPYEDTNSAEPPRYPGPARPQAAP